MLKIELALSVLAVVWAFAFPSVGARAFDKVESTLRPIAQRRTLSVIGVGILAVLARVAVLPVLPIPAPAIHDEFSYLLMADTFAHGRLANPTPPLWVHFETFHENMIPKYASMFYPAQGVFLAFGQILFRSPFVGVVLSCALMCGALCWMLQEWIAPTWALLGSVLAVVRIATFSYWANSYWGGAVAALGGALVLGAFPRITNRKRVRDCLLFAVGVALLLNSRPYESIFFLTPIALALALSFGRQSKNGGTAGRKIGIYLVAFLALTFASMGYYFWRTTGTPFRPAYLENIRQYTVAPYFPWQNLKPSPEYRHAVMRDFYEQWPVPQYHDARQNPIQMATLKAVYFWFFFCGPALTILFAACVFALPYGFKFREMSGQARFLIAVSATTLLGLALPIYFLPHYAAPLTCVIYAMAMLAARFLWRWTPRGRPLGRALVLSTVITCFALVPLRAFAARLGVHLTAPALKTWASRGEQFSSREDVGSSLRTTAGQHLVIVRYAPNHDFMAEWVYNGADIEHERIIWARDMGSAKNQEVIDYFKDRRVWLVEPDETPPRLQPYSALSERKITAAPSFP